MQTAESNVIAGGSKVGHQVPMANELIEMSEGKTLVDAGYRRLRHDIIAGIRPPGERLRIEKLKAIYGIGPTPLREALQKLGQDGLVVTEGNRGFTVAPLDAAEFEDLNLARTVIEKEALRLSIARGGNSWEARVVAASYIMAKEDEALTLVPDRVPDSWERANGEFHAALVSACGSAWLLRVRSGLPAPRLPRPWIRAHRNHEGGARSRRRAIL
jgi:GntR family transcriptional regulator, carbon starvation induced regulator